MSLFNLYIVNADKTAQKSYQTDGDGNKSKFKKNAYDNLHTEMNILKKCSDHKHVGPIISADEKIPEISSNIKYCMRWTVPIRSISKINKLPLFVVFVYRPKNKTSYCVWHHIGGVVNDIPNREWHMKNSEIIVSLSDPVIITSFDFIYESLHYWNFRDDKIGNYPGFTEKTYIKGGLGFTRGNNFTIMAEEWMIKDLDTDNRLFSAKDWINNWYPKPHMKYKKDGMRIEHIYLKFISSFEKFKNIKWIPQKYVNIRDENKKRYIDFLFVGPNLVILEIDEKSHSDRNPQEELIRMEQIVKGLIVSDKSMDRPFVFLRVNPHHPKADIERTMNMVYELLHSHKKTGENLIYVNYDPKYIPQSATWPFEVINY